MLFRWMQRRAAAELKSRLGEGSILAIEERSNGFGVESGGPFQIRGNGCLALTDEELAFLMWLPRRELRIPRASITGVERTRWHLGKTMGRDLLKVRFTNHAGAPDSAAWLVGNLAMWEALLAD